MFPTGDLAVPKLYCFYKWNFKCLGGGLSNFLFVQGEVRTPQRLESLPLQDFTGSSFQVTVSHSELILQTII